MGKTGTNKDIIVKTSRYGRTWLRLLRGIFGWLEGMGWWADVSYELRRLVKGSSAKEARYLPRRYALADMQSCSQRGSEAPSHGRGVVSGENG